MLALLALLLLLAPAGAALAASRLPEFLGKVEPGEILPEADRLGPVRGEPPIAPAYKGDQLVGFAYLNSDFANSVGYSGKPIHIVVGIDLKGRITGLKLVDHKEPIVLIGIPERKIVDALGSLIGADIGQVATGAVEVPHVDIVSGATVTVLVMGDSIIRSAIHLVRSGRIAGTQGPAAAAPAAAPAKRVLDLTMSEVRDWESLVGDGSVRRLHLSVGEVNEAFARSGDAEAAARPEPGDPDDTFIDLYTALVTIPTIGRSLLGDAAYQQLVDRLKPGQHAIVVAANGPYSFKGSGYVRGGIFDRIELIQDLDSVRFRDRDHRRLADLAAAGAPQFREIGLFTLPEGFAFDPAEPWRLQLLVQRATGALTKAFLNFDLSYTPPDKYFRSEPAAPTAAQAAAPAAAEAPPAAQPPGAAPEAGALAMPGSLGQPLWQRIWLSNKVDIAILTVALLVLTGLFFFQDSLVRRYRLYLWVRRAWLLFTLLWIGWYANAQLSVVNVLTFTNALMADFSWEYFLAAPLIFILWFSVAAALLFWGRGPFCGWLCPFGALQELTNNAAQALRVPQIKVPWGVNERLWPIKYIIFLVLFGLSLYSAGVAEVAAEVEPFKTAIILKFLRDWPFVLYAVGLLVIGLFIERFFCRYLCPLGAALAIPGRISMFFGWLKRHPECGSPCQRCAKECPVQCIHPDGHINPNECIYCMHCQDLYWDEHRCPAMIQRRLKREKRQALASPSKRAGAAPARAMPAAAPAAATPADTDRS